MRLNWLGRHKVVLICKRGAGNRLVFFTLFNTQDIVDGAWELNVRRISEQIEATM